MSTGERIRRRRKELGLSQEQLAHEVGVTRNTAASWETRNVVPEGANLDRLALALGVTADWILRGDRRLDAESPKIPDPPRWQEFLEKYEHLDELGDEQLEALRVFAARSGLRGRSWTDYERIVEVVRASQDSPTFQAKRKTKRG